MYCNKCGFQLPDDANYCLKCGVPQKDIKRKVKKDYTRLFFNGSAFSFESTDEDLANKVKDRIESFINNPRKIKFYEMGNTWKVYYNSHISHELHNFMISIKPRLVQNGWKSLPTASQEESEYTREVAE